MFDDAKKLQEHLDATREDRERLSAEILVTANVLIHAGADPTSVAAALVAAGASILSDLVAPEHVAGMLRQMADAADRIPDRRPTAN